MRRVEHQFTLVSVLQQVHLALHLWLIVELIHEAEKPIIMALCNLMVVSLLLKYRLLPDLIGLKIEAPITVQIANLVALPLRMYALGSKPSESMVLLVYIYFVFYSRLFVRKHIHLFLASIFIFINCILFPCISWAQMRAVAQVASILCASTIAIQDQKLELETIYKDQTLHLSSVYHEIRTPLNAIVCATEIIKEELRDISPDKKKVIKEWLGIIHSSSTSLNAIIDNMMNFSRDTSNIGKDLRDFNLREFISTIKNLISSYPRSSQVKIIFQFKDPLPEIIRSDSIALQQILLNILTNSLKFTHYGEVSLLIQKIGDKFLEFVIRDTGVGMDRDFVNSKLFRPFNQEERGIFSKMRGLGLGLAISKRIIETMGGDISVMTKKGSGTEITVRIPLIPLSLSSTTIISHHDLDEEDLHEINGDTYTALIVDDNDVNRRVMLALMSRFGFICEVSESGEECISRFKKGETFDIILMDIFMPGLDGFETTLEILKLLKGKPHCPLIFGCSADTSPTTLLRCKEVGLHFVHKPLSREMILELRSKIQK